MRVKGQVALVLLAVCLGSCADPTPEAPIETPRPLGVFLPTYRPMDGLPTAQISGRLIEEQGCLWIEQGATRVLPLWPPGSTVESDGGSTVVINGGARATVGSPVSGGGGEYGQGNYDVVVEAIGGQVPAECRGEDQYWLVYDVRSEGE